MPKALCITGIAVAILLLLIFALDLALPYPYNPFKGVSAVMDITMLASALILGFLSWLTLREL
jgi:hypothetical protein